MAQKRFSMGLSAEVWQHIYGFCNNDAKVALNGTCKFFRLYRPRDEDKALMARVCSFKRRFATVRLLKEPDYDHNRGNYIVMLSIGNKYKLRRRYGRSYGSEGGTVWERMMRVANGTDEDECLYNWMWSIPNLQCRRYNWLTHETRLALD